MQSIPGHDLDGSLGDGAADVPNPPQPPRPQLPLTLNAHPPADAELPASTGDAIDRQARREARRSRRDRQHTVDGEIDASENTNSDGYDQGANTGGANDGPGQGRRWRDKDTGEPVHIDVPSVGDECRAEDAEPMWAPPADGDAAVDVGAFLQQCRTGPALGTGHHLEGALGTLYASHYDVSTALLAVHATPRELLDWRLASTWTAAECAAFDAAMAAHGKNFPAVSRQVGSKTTKECVGHYYHWKKTLGAKGVVKGHQAKLALSPFRSPTTLSKKPSLIVCRTPTLDSPWTSVGLTSLSVANAKASAALTKEPSVQWVASSAAVAPRLPLPSVVVSSLAQPSLSPPSAVPMVLSATVGPSPTASRPRSSLATAAAAAAAMNKRKIAGEPSPVTSDGPLVAGQYAVVDVAAATSTTTTATFQPNKLNAKSCGQEAPSPPPPPPPLLSQPSLPPAPLLPPDSPPKQPRTQPPLSVNDDESPHQPVTRKRPAPVSSGSRSDSPWTPAVVKPVSRPAASAASAASTAPTTAARAETPAKPPSKAPQVAIKTSPGASAAEKPGTNRQATETGVYDVEAIVRHRKRNGQLEYLVKWEGYPSSENTWEPIKNLSKNSVFLAYRDGLAGRDANSAGAEGGDGSLADDDDDDGNGASPPAKRACHSRGPTAAAGPLRYTVVEVQSQPLACTVAGCRQFFQPRQMAHLTAHINRDHPGEPCRCRFAEKATSDSLATHIARQSCLSFRQLLAPGMPMTACSRCNALFTSLELARAHFKVVH